MSTQHRSHLASTPQRGPSHQPVAGPSTQQHLPSEDAYVSLDCEFVGVLTQGQLEENALAEVSLVDYWGNILYQSYCAPDGPVSDYRTWVSGVKREHLIGAPSFHTVRERVKQIIHNKILVGHALHNDLAVLKLDHPPHRTRDTCTYLPFWTKISSCIPSLKKLAEAVLNKQIQTGEHSAFTDARHTMEIFLTERVAWETALLQGVNVVGTPPPLGSPGSAGIVPTVSSPSISPLISVQQQQFVNQTPTLNRQQQQQPFPLSFSPHLNPPFSPFAAPSQNMPPPPGLGAPFPGVTQHFSAPPQAPQSIAPALQLANQPLPPKGEGPSQMPKNLKALDAIKALGNPGLTHPASTSVPFSSVHSPASFPSPSGLNGAFWSSMNPAQAPVQYQHFRSTSLDMTNSPSPMYNRQRQVSLSARSGSPKGSPRGARGSGGNRRMQHQSPKKASSGASKSHSIDTHQRAPSPSSTGSSTHLSDASSSDGDIFGSSRRSIPSVNAGKSSPFSSESVVSSATSIYSSSGDGSKESSAPSTPKRVQAQRYRVPLLAPTIAAA